MSRQSGAGAGVFDAFWQGLALYDANTSDWVWLCESGLIGCSHENTVAPDERKYEYVDPDRQVCAGLFAGAVTALEMETYCATIKTLNLRYAVYISLILARLEDGDPERVAGVRHIDVFEGQPYLLDLCWRGAGAALRVVTRPTSARLTPISEQAFVRFLESVHDHYRP